MTMQLLILKRLMQSNREAVANLEVHSFQNHLQLWWDLWGSSAECLVETHFYDLGVQLPQVLPEIWIPLGNEKVENYQHMPVNK